MIKNVDRPAIDAELAAQRQTSLWHSQNITKEVLTHRVKTSFSSLISVSHNIHFAAGADLAFRVDLARLLQSHLGEEGADQLVHQH